MMGASKSVKSLIHCLGMLWRKTWAGEVKGSELLQLFQRDAFTFSPCECLVYILLLWKRLYDHRQLKGHWAVKVRWLIVHSLRAGRGEQTPRPAPPGSWLPTAGSFSSKVLKVWLGWVILIWAWILDLICFSSGVCMNWFCFYLWGLSCFVTADALFVNLLCLWNMAGINCPYPTLFGSPRRGLGKEGCRAKEVKYLFSSYCPIC